MKDFQVFFWGCVIYIPFYVCVSLLESGRKNKGPYQDQIGFNETSIFN